MNKKDTTLDGGFSVSRDMAEERVGRCMKGRSERQTREAREGQTGGILEVKDFAL